MCLIQRTAQYVLVAAAAAAGLGEMHHGIPSCLKSSRVTSSVFLLKQAEQVRFWDTWGVLGGP